ncbi:MAG: leucine-rich repeat protein [Clostridiales bacterium]|nr:leucine-rich repeat protein [Clostridiales bacterium]
MKRLKTVFIALLPVCIVFVFSACGANPNREGEIGGDEADNGTYYTVTFDSQGGSEVESQTILEGNPVRRPQTPIREGFFLNGWYTSAATTANSEWHFDTDRVDGDIILYAGWTVDTSEETTGSLVFAKEGNAYTVSGMTGEETIVVIPSEYNGLPVTKIQGEYGTGAFARKAITSVTIPDSIEEIGQNSFNNCSALASVNIGTASSLKKIGNNAFSGNAALKQIYLPSGMINLGDSVFNNCGNIERFIVADGNAAYSSENGHLIEKATAALMRGANNKEVPDGVKVIASAAFRKSTLKQLAIPATVEKIENYIIQDSAIEEIVYGGTEEQWEQIQKAKLWNIGKENISIKYNISQDEEITSMFITINGKKLEITLENNSSVTALVGLLKQDDITYTASDYGGFEKVGSLGHTLPTNHTQLTTQPGDVILYQSNQIVLFYGSNTWSAYTKIGRIKYNSLDELKSFLSAGQGSVQVTLSLK